MVSADLGYRAVQYNLVVATNEGAVRLWKSMGFGRCSASSRTVA